MRKVGTLAERTCKQPGLPGTQPRVALYHRKLALPASSEPGRGAERKANE
ncbi:MAG: hypothetical protein WCO42_09370 [bacterium]